jgi:hypothetical protein
VRRAIRPVRRATPWGQPLDGAVAESEEDQFGQLSGGGHDADVAAPAGADLVADLPEVGGGGHALDGLDRGPADQAAALFICGSPGRQRAGCPVDFRFLDLLGGG